MTHIYAAALACLLASLCPVVAQTAIEEMPPAQAGAQESGNALLAGNFERFVDLLYPVLVEQMGGRDSAIAIIRNSIASFRDQGLTFSAITTTTPSSYDTIGSRIFAVVPTEMTMRAPNGRYITETLMLGVSDGDDRWTFIDPGSSPAAGLSRIFPEEPGLADRLGLEPRNPPRFEEDE